MKQPVKLAFFGTGTHATDSLYPCIPHIEDTEIVAVHSRTIERAELTARRFGIGYAYADVEKLLDSEKIDGAVIVGPPEIHLSIGLACLERGIPVFVEKPPAVDTPSTRKLVETAAGHSTFGMVGLNKRYALGYRIAKELISRKEFGEVTSIELKFSNGAWPPFWGVEERALTFLSGQAIHMFDLIRYFAGEVETVYALFSRRSVDRFGFAVQAKLASDALVTCNMTCYESWNTFSERVSVTGEGNYISVENGLHLKYHREKNWIDLPDTEIYNLYHGWDVSGPMPRTSNFSHEHLGYLGEMRAFVNAVRMGEKPTPDLLDGLRAMEFCDAVWESVRSGKPVNPDFSFRLAGSG